jgi:hypothetical protein
MSPGKHVSPQHLAESSKTLVFARSSGILKWNLSCANKHRTCKQLGFVRLWAWQDVIIWYYMLLAPLVDWSVSEVARCCRRVETCLVCLPQLRMPRQTPWQLLTAPGGFMESSATSVKSQTLGVRMTRTGEIMMKLWWKMLASKIFQLLKHGSTIGTHGI